MLPPSRENVLLLLRMESIPISALHRSRASLSRLQNSSLGAACSFNTALHRQCLFSHAVVLAGAAWKSSFALRAAAGEREGLASLV